MASERHGNDTISVRNCKGINVLGGDFAGLSSYTAIIRSPTPEQVEPKRFEHEIPDFELTRSHRAHRRAPGSSFVRLRRVS
jgi:hypothetical protein